MITNVQTNNNAPDDIEMFSISSQQNSAFCCIMELTKEEKRELLQLWKERLYSGS